MGGGPSLQRGAWQPRRAMRCSRCFAFIEDREMSMFERKLRYVGLGVVVCMALGAAAQQQPDIGPRPVKVADTPYTFDTAEQHGIKVSVVVRGLGHPFSLALLPNRDELVNERRSSIRRVQNVAGAE